MLEPETITFPASDWVPNHPRLPVLIYRQALSGPSAQFADLLEERFLACGWQGTWRNGIFPYQHYHTGAHEVLGVAQGHARVLIGGPNGSVLEVKAGDCLVLPAGTGHMKLEATGDFLVVGSYPPGQDADIQTEAPDTAQEHRIDTLPLPQTDPLFGADGPLVRLWTDGSSPA
jgi:uncharacterized protein YjlB